jgi:ketosteroid isomerase-like protein
VVGNKAYTEFQGEATQLNGKPYNNYYLWVLIFEDDGLIHEIREYLDTGLVREVFTNN